MDKNKVLRDTFNDKTVAVVGNADSLFPLNYGTDIDNHDVVVRINKGALICFDKVTPEVAKSHGRKTDVWVMARQEIRQVLPKHQGKAGLVIATCPESAPSSNYIVCTDRVSELTEQFGSPPSTGVRLLDLLKDLNCKTVDVYGFDWKETDTFYERNRKREIHDFAAERDYCLNFLVNKCKFKIYG